MILTGDEIKPIYLQIADGIEDEILKGNIKEGEQVLSTNQFASMYQINPATAAKGINLLTDEGILFKKRGIGMFVADGAKEYIIRKRRKRYYEEYLLKALQEAQKLNISKEELIEMVRNGGDSF